MSVHIGNMTCAEVFLVGPRGGGVESGWDTGEVKLKGTNFYKGQNQCVWGEYFVEY